MRTNHFSLDPGDQLFALQGHLCTLLDFLNVLVTHSKNEPHAIAMAFETPPMETLLSSFFNIRPTDSFVCLFYQNLQYPTETVEGERARRERGEREARETREGWASKGKTKKR